MRKQKRKLFFDGALSGFSLIEVLVSLLLLSFILFGFDSAEIYSVREIRAAYYFDMANDQLNNMIERLQAIGDQTDMSQSVTTWNIQNKNLLPQGMGEVLGVFPTYKINIFWGENRPPCQQNQLGSSGCITRNVTI